MFKLFYIFNKLFCWSKVIYKIFKVYNKNVEVLLYNMLYCYKNLIENVVE